MNMRTLTLAAILSLTAFGVALADDVKPTLVDSLNLGDVSVVAYYTVERDGYRVVTTLAKGETGTPIRFESVLAPGQSVLLSTDSGVGVAPVSVEISRKDGTVHVRKTAVTN
jgi:hypothetical protein